MLTPPSTVRNDIERAVKAKAEADAWDPAAPEEPERDYLLQESSIQLQRNSSGGD